MSDAGSVNCPFVVHFHQPVGQLDRVLDRVYEHSYKPWLRVFEKHPAIQFSLHFSGCLLEWLAKNHPDYIAKLETLTKKRQLEFVGGGYYEPILPMIPDADKKAQIQLLTEYLATMLSVKPAGLWLAERVWEPTLPKVLAEMNMQYVLIDDYHMRASGYSEQQTYYTYYTEEQNRSLVLFPINERLRYLMLWEPQERSIEYLRQARTSEGDRVVVYITDAEKYGEWSDPAYAEQWLHRYFDLVEEKSWLVSVHLAEYLQKHAPKGLIYIPCAAYDKMVEWADGHFRNFLARYAESNNMHKRMLLVRDKLTEASGVGVSAKVLADAKRHLFAAQCNDAYWHGLFGGVYLPNLRQALFSHLIRAEALVEQAVEEKTGEPRTVKVIQRDIDYDGQLELLVEGKRLNAYIKPSDGGNLFELDYKGNSVFHNFASTLTRRREKYHESWEHPPLTDWYRRTLLRDHILRKDSTLNSLIGMEPMFDQGDFTIERFEYSIEQSPSQATIKLLRIGHDWSNGSEAKLQISKSLIVPLDTATLTSLYELKNLSNKPLILRFAPESTLIPPVTFEYTPSTEELQNYPINVSGKSSKLNINLLEAVAVGAAERVILSDVGNNLQVEVSWSRVADCWVLPLKAMARTEKKPMEIYEGTSLMPIFNLNLTPDQTQTINLEFKITETNG
ncbi:MAG TPA: alpha-amylase/4-alpha-glucanotransferase domain-containing protein [Candidatus Bathyarchaeia archaeon]|nr:alpha-amylase/4-alpha-glucanotransferase domain-containing protein [Candidatus Bathyarchaeia archaeon]